MPSHQIEFQHGMSIPEFVSYFGTEAQCAQALPVRWLPLSDLADRRDPENKVPFVAAVSTNDAGQPIRLELDIVSGFTSDAIAKWAKASLLPKTVVTSDGLGCFAAVTEAGCTHMPRVVGVLKTMMSGAFKALRDRRAC